MILDTLAEYVTAILEYDATLVIIGRENAIKQNSLDGYIMVDRLGQAVPIGKTDTFDGDTEIKQYVQSMSGDFTLDFYGTDANLNAETFTNKQRTQLAHDFQRINDIRVHKVSAFRDIKVLEGLQYKNRIQVEFSVIYNVETNVDTLRIDTAQLEFLVNN